MQDWSRLNFFEHEFWISFQLSIINFTVNICFYKSNSNFFYRAEGLLGVISEFPFTSKFKRIFGDELNLIFLEPVDVTACEAKQPLSSECFLLCVLSIFLLVQHLTFLMTSFQLLIMKKVEDVKINWNIFSLPFSSSMYNFYGFYMCKNNMIILIY